MDEPLDWRFCVMGNIRRSHIGEDGCEHYGSKAFSGGTKVYLDGRLRQPSDGSFSVIGRNRFGRYVVERVSLSLIENIRAGRVFQPQVLDLMWKLERLDGWVWWGRSSADRRDTERFVREWQSDALQMQ